MKKQLSSVNSISGSKSVWEEDCGLLSPVWDLMKLGGIKRRFWRPVKQRKKGGKVPESGPFLLGNLIGGSDDIAGKRCWQRQRRYAGVKMSGAGIKGEIELKSETQCIKELQFTPRRSPFFFLQIFAYFPLMKMSFLLSLSLFWENKGRKSARRIFQVAKPPQVDKDQHQIRYSSTGSYGKLRIVSFSWDYACISDLWPCLSVTPVWSIMAGTQSRKHLHEIRIFLLRSWIMALMTITQTGGQTKRHQVTLQSYCFFLIQRWSGVRHITRNYPCSLQKPSFLPFYDQQFS